MSNVQRPTSAFPRLKVHIPFDSFATQTLDIPARSSSLEFNLYVVLGARKLKLEL